MVRRITFGERKKIKDFSAPRDEEERDRINKEQETGGDRSITQKAEVVKTKKKPKEKKDPKDQITKAAEAGFIPPEQAENLLTQIEAEDGEREPKPQFKESRFSVEDDKDFLGFQSAVRGVGKNIFLPLIKALGIGTKEQIADAERQFGSATPFFQDVDNLNAAFWIAGASGAISGGIKLLGGRTLAKSVAPNMARITGAGETAVSGSLKGLAKAGGLGRLTTSGAQTGARATITKTVSAHRLTRTAVSGTNTLQREQLLGLGTRTATRSFLGKPTTDIVIKQLAKMNQITVGNTLKGIGKLALKHKGKVALGVTSITGAQAAFAYFGADNVITGQDIYTRDLADMVTFGGMSIDQAAPLFDDAENRVDTAQRTLKILMLNPLLRAVGGGILLTNAESVRRNIKTRKQAINLI